MNILFLDDDDSRHELVERHLSKNHIIFHAFNADEALNVITTCFNCKRNLGLAMLDHDLQDFAEQDGNKYERHGVYFLNKMFDMPEEMWPAQFVLHSYNPVGAKSMFTDLQNKKQTCTMTPFSVQMLARLAMSIRPE